MANNVFTLFQFILRILRWYLGIIVICTTVFSKLSSTEEPLKYISISWGTPSYDNVCRSEKVDKKERNSRTANLLSKALICKMLLLKARIHCRKKLYSISSSSINNYNFSLRLNISTLLCTIFIPRYLAELPIIGEPRLGTTSIQHWFRLQILGCGPGMLRISVFWDVYLVLTVVLCSHTLWLAKVIKSLSLAAFLSTQWLYGRRGI
jgi:hypothetical protein